MGRSRSGDRLPTPTVSGLTRVFGAFVQATAPLESRDSLEVVDAMQAVGEESAHEAKEEAVVHNEASPEVAAKEDDDTEMPDGNFANKRTASATPFLSVGDGADGEEVPQAPQALQVEPQPQTP